MTTLVDDSPATRRERRADLIARIAELKAELVELERDLSRADPFGRIYVFGSFRPRTRFLVYADNADEAARKIRERLKAEGCSADLQPVPAELHPFDAVTQSTHSGLFFALTPDDSERLLAHALDWQKHRPAFARQMAFERDLAAYVRRTSY